MKNTRKIETRGNRPPKWAADHEQYSHIFQGSRCLEHIWRMIKEYWAVCCWEKDMLRKNHIVDRASSYRFQSCPALSASNIHRFGGIQYFKPPASTPYCKGRCQLEIHFLLIVYSRVQGRRTRNLRNIRNDNKVPAYEIKGSFCSFLWDRHTGIWGQRYM